MDISLIYLLMLPKHLCRLALIHEAGLKEKFYEGFVQHHREDNFSPVAIVRALDGGTTACLNLTGLEMLRSLIGNDDNKKCRNMIFSRTTYQNAQLFIEEEAAKIAQVTVKDGAVSLDVVAALEAILSAVPHLEARGISQEDWDAGVRSKLPIYLG